MNLDQHVKNKLITQFHSGDAVNFRVQRPDWPVTIFNHAQPKNFFIRPFCLLPGVQLYKDQQIKKGRNSMKKTKNNNKEYDSNHPGMTAKLKKKNKCIFSQKITHICSLFREEISVCALVCTHYVTGMCDRVQYIILLTIMMGHLLCLSC